MGYGDIGVRKSEFVTKTQFLSQAFYTHDDPYGNTTQWGQLDDEFFAANPEVIKDIYK